MKHDDETLQAAIDAAMIEIGKQVSGPFFAACPKAFSFAWPVESPARLALAKTFLAKLPSGLQASEADKALADLASRLANIAYDPVQPRAFAKAVADHVDDLREDINHAQKVSLADARTTDATIARLNAELGALRQPILADDGRSLGQVATEAFIGAPGLTDDWMNAAAQAVANVVLAKAIRRMEAVPEEELMTLYRESIEDELHSFEDRDEGEFTTDKVVELALESVRARLIAAARGEAEQQADSTDWKARAEKAEAELAEASHRENKWHSQYQSLMNSINDCKAFMGWPEHKPFFQEVRNTQADLAALKSSPIGILRPLSEAGPVPDGCSRISGYRKTDGQWALAIWGDEYDTHFADIRLPSTETPATVNEQPKQQVPLGPEEKLQAIKDILEIK